MGGMSGVLHDTGSFAGASCKENIQDGGERGTNDFCSGVHCKTIVVVYSGHTTTIKWSYDYLKTKVVNMTSHFL